MGVEEEGISPSFTRWISTVENVGVTESATIDRGVQAQEFDGRSRLLQKFEGRNEGKYSEVRWRELEPQHKCL